MVVFLIFLFAIGQMFMLGRVCNSGMKTAMSLEQRGLPTLNQLASLQEHLAIYRLNSYEFLFAREEEKAAKAEAAQNVIAQIRKELKNIRTLHPGGEGGRLVSNLESALNELEIEFGKVRDLAESDFAAAVKATDQDIPPRIERAAESMRQLRDYGNNVSGAEAKATFGSFVRIKQNTVVFGIASIILTSGAVIFVRLAARHSRAQLTSTLVRLDERTEELAGSLSVVHATLESTADGIVLIDESGKIGNYNRQFIKMWAVAELGEIMRDKQLLTPHLLPLLKHPEKYARKLEELAVDPEQESFDVLELKDTRVFECYSKPQRIHSRIGGRVWSFRDVTEQKRTEAELEKINLQLMEASRMGGMAEIATNVLHNVGNALNSVNVSAQLVIEGAGKSKVSSFAKVVALLQEHQNDIADFVTRDPRGQKLIEYLPQLSEQLHSERDTTVSELRILLKNIEHIREIVAMQQNYARVYAVKESIEMEDLLEDALRMNADSLNRHGVAIIREYEDVPTVNADKHKILQVLVNLIRNAKQACKDSDQKDKRVTLRLKSQDDRIKITVADNGVGIPSENLTRIFNHGFTTRKNGSGFGLHSSALAAKEIGGSLIVTSPGIGQGAEFIFEFPYGTRNEENE